VAVVALVAVVVLEEEVEIEERGEDIHRSILQTEPEKKRIRGAGGKKRRKKTMVEPFAHPFGLM
jgi:hypothetical protein